MTNEEMKQALAKGGIATADIEKISDKYDAEKITEIVEGANNPKEAFENLHAFYPELEVEALQKQCDFVMEQIEAAMKEKKKSEAVELTEEELEHVAGGGFWSSVGDFFKDNWKKLAVGAAVVVGTALVCTGIGAGVGVAMYGAASGVAGGLGAAASLGIGGAATAAASSAMAGIVATGVGVAAGVGGAIGSAVGGVTTAVLAGTGVLDKLD